MKTAPFASSNEHQYGFTRQNRKPFQTPMPWRTQMRARMHRDSALLMKAIHASRSRQRSRVAWAKTLRTARCGTYTRTPSTTTTKSAASRPNSTRKKPQRYLITHWKRFVSSRVRAVLPRRVACVRRIRRLLPLLSTTKKARPSDLAVPHVFRPTTGRILLFSADSQRGRKSPTAALKPSFAGWSDGWHGLPS